MKVGVLALQGDVREHFQVLAELGAHPVEVRTPEDLTGVDAMVLPGGESTTISMLLDSSGLRRPLGARLAEGMPALGTCAGMVLLATEVLDGRSDQESFGAIDLTVRRNAFGRQVASFETDLDVPRLSGQALHAVFIRAPVVERAGPAVEVLARVADSQGVLRPVLCRQGVVVAAAFHPELSGDWRVHEMFLAGR